MLSRNVGSADRIIRLVLGVALLALFLIDSPIRWVGIAGIILIATSGLSFCPIYFALGMRTCPAETR